MLDLNVEIISGDDDRLMFVGKRAADAGEEETEHEEEENEHSAGTSDSSSVVNADEASAAANAGDEGSSAAFVFDVFKKEKAKEGSFPPELVTRQLFPVPSGSPDELGVGSVKPASAPRPQWLNLSFGRAGGGGGGSGDPPMTGEMKSFQQPQRQQQVRKSRRGPRSRSSQYRGVTFYRRTGRWESHIW